MARTRTNITEEQVRAIIAEALQEKKQGKRVSVPFVDVRQYRGYSPNYSALPQKRKKTGALSQKEVKARYSPPITNGRPVSEQMAMDEALTTSGYYSLLQHTFAGIGDCLFPQFLGYGVLSGLMQNQVIRSGIEMMADEMTRKWIKITRIGEVDLDAEETDDDGGIETFEKDLEELEKEERRKTDVEDKTIQALEQEMRRFDIPKLFRRAFALSGYMGGCLIYIDTLGDDATSEELLSPLRYDEDVFGAGDLKGFRIVEPFNISPGYYQSTNPLREDYFRPETWWVQGREVHASRFLYFAVNTPSTLILPAYNFFGIPIAQLVLDSVSHFTRTREATARALEKYSLTVFKTNLAEIPQAEFRDEIIRRVQYLADWRDNNGIEIIDFANEDIQTVVSPIAGMTDIVRQAMDIVSAMFNEPAVKLWGITPAGMNATGQADLTNHYDNIASLQESVFSSPLNKLMKVLQWNLFEELDDSITYNFEPLGIMNETTLSQIRTANANVDATYISNGVLSAEEVRSRVANDPTAGYTNIDISNVPKPRNTNMLNGKPDEMQGTKPGEQANGDNNAPTYTTLSGITRRIQ